MPTDPITGDSWAVASLDDLGEGPGFRKVRGPLGVTAFGANAVVLPPAYTTRRHFHERQEELYLVLRGEIEIEFGDGEKHTLGPGGLARVSPATVRRLRSASDSEEATTSASAARTATWGATACGRTARASRAAAEAAR